MDEHEGTITSACEQAVERLRAAMPDIEATAIVREGNVLRQVAHRGRLRVIYEFPRHLGGVIWRAFELTATQLVEDVRDDPDYIAVDTSIRSEIAAPLVAGGHVVGILNAETADRAFGPEDVAVVEREAACLAADLEPFYSPS